MEWSLGRPSRKCLKYVAFPFQKRRNKKAVFTKLRRTPQSGPLDVRVVAANHEPISKIPQFLNMSCGTDKGLDREDVRAAHGTPSRRQESVPAIHVAGP